MGSLIFAAIALAYLVYSSRDRVNALVGAAVLLPYNQYLPSGGLPLMNIQTLVLVGVFVAWVRAPRNTDNPRPAAPALLAFLAILITLAYLHSFFAEIPVDYRSYYKPWGNFLIFKEWLSVLFLFYVAFVLVDGAEAAKKLFWGAVVGFGAESVFCFFEFMLRSTKVTGHMEVRNASGAFLGIYAALAFGVFLAYKVPTRRLWFLSLSVAATAGALGTRSRGAVLPLVAVGLFATLLKSRILFVALLVLVVTYQSWMPAPILNRIDDAYEVSAGGDVEIAGTAQQRIEIWKAGTRAIGDHPFGLGFGMFPLFVPKYGLEEVLVRPSKNAHNVYMLTAAELGPVGLVVLLGLLLGIARSAWHASGAEEDPVLRGAAFGAFTGLLGALSACLIGDFLFRLDLCGIVWILAGMACRRSGELRRVRRRPGVRERRVPARARG